MKAKNLQTGEIVDNFGYSREYGTVSYIDSTGLLKFDMTPVDKWQVINDNNEPEVMTMDANKFKGFMSDYALDKRTQVAISAMNGILANYDQFRHTIVEAYEEGEIHSIPVGVAKFAVACADALLQQLSTKNKENETV